MTSSSTQPPLRVVKPATHHVWVRTPHVPVEHQGLLLHWAESPEGWMGLATWIDQAGAAVGPQWIPAAWIRPERSRRVLAGTAYDAGNDETAPPSA